LHRPCCIIHAAECAAWVAPCCTMARRGATSRAAAMQHARTGAAGPTGRRSSRGAGALATSRGRTAPARGGAARSAATRHAHACARAQARTLTHAYTHTPASACTHSDTHSRTHVRTRTLACSFVACSHTHRRTRTMRATSSLRAR
jgi:hypothetical protein